MLRFVQRRLAHFQSVHFQAAHFQAHLQSVLIAAMLAGSPLAARAAESYDNCAGTVASLPATIGTSGVWCMKSDLSTAMSSGVAISITANNVTLDCNGFRLGGLAAGTSTGATGIAALGRANVTVRNCIVRGFYDGVYLGGGSGNVVEDNRFDSNTRSGVRIDGDSYVIRRNLIMQTGLSTVTSTAYGVFAPGAAGLIEANFISGVAGNSTMFSFANAVGIASGGSYSVVRGNDVTGVYSAGESAVVGIDSSGAKSKLLNNTVSALHSPTGTRRGLNCTGAPTTVAAGNTISDASSTPDYVYACLDSGNVVH